ncbi:MAG: hypothetical protein WBB67_12095 [bacterium]
MNFIMNKIRICGSKKNVAAASCILKKCSRLVTSTESEARLCIQSLIDTYALKATILWDGNTVWSKTRVLNDLYKLLKYGMTALSDYLYAFFHLCCGSIAYYDKHGWISHYPDIPSLKRFLLCNELGQDVLSNQPWWATDRIEIIKGIYVLLNLARSS